MKLEDRMFSQSTTEQVVANASHPEWHLDKAHAIYELAIRALEDSSLLRTAWKCIGNEITYASRQGPPLGQPAAALLIDSNRDIVEVAMVEALNGWSKGQQADFFLGLFDKDERKSVVNRLHTKYAFTPKVTITPSGDIVFE